MPLHAAIRVDAYTYQLGLEKYFTLVDRDPLVPKCSSRLRHIQMWQAALVILLLLASLEVDFSHFDFHDRSAT